MQKALAIANKFIHSKSDFLKDWYRSKLLTQYKSNFWVNFGLDQFIK